MVKSFNPFPGDLAPGYSFARSTPKRTTIDVNHLFPVSPKVINWAKNVAKADAESVEDELERLKKLSCKERVSDQQIKDYFYIQFLIRWVLWITIFITIHFFLMPVLLSFQEISIEGKDNLYNIELFVYCLIAIILGYNLFLEINMKLVARLFINTHGSIIKKAQFYK